MIKRIIVTLATLSLCMLGACSKDVPYNSNTGDHGSRDSAAQLTIGQSQVDEINGLIGDNEDWYYFIPKEVGTIDIMVSVDNPKNGDIVISLLDSFGRTVEDCNSASVDSACKFKSLQIESVAQETRYFLAVKTQKGQSPYTINLAFEPPYVPPPEEKVVEDAPEQTETVKEPCVPADKCKAGQKCCRKKDKPAPAPADDEPASKPITGSIVLVTPRSGDLMDIKISGINKNNAKPGMKAFVRGIKRKVDIYSCMTTFCQATVKATTEELANHDKVDVYTAE